MEMELETSLYEYMPYTRRPGSVDDNKYELNMASLTALTLVLHGDEKSWMASNAKGVGAFDDLIVNFKNVTYLCQLKHSSKSSMITQQELCGDKGDYSLPKYAEDLAKVVGANTERVARYLSQQKMFCLYTNRDCNDHGLLQEGEVADGSLFPLLNTSKQTNWIYQIRDDQFETLPNSEHRGSIRLLVNQMNKYDIQELIQSKIKNIITHFNLENVDVDLAQYKFSSYIEKWARGSLGGHYCLTKQHILSTVVEIFFSPYKLSVLEPHEVLDGLADWQKLIKDKNITIVNSDDNNHVGFVKQDILNQIKHFGGIDFYHNHSKTASQIEEKEENTEALYRCLWYESRIPLLVKMDDDAYFNLFKFLDFYGCNLKFIVVTNVSEAPNAFAEIKNLFSSLRDLEPSNIKLVLDKTVFMQGRESWKLCDVVNESMYSLIKTKDIIDIIAGTYTIGNTDESVPNYYIQPQLQKLLFRIEVLSEISKNYYLIENPNNIALKILTCNLNQFVGSKCHVILLAGTESHDEVSKKLRTVNKPVHHFRVFTDKILEWIESTGSITNIRNYQIPSFTLQDWVTIEEQLSVKRLIVNKSVIITAIPGMGKSTLLNYVAANVRSQGWILKINLNNYIDYFEKVCNSATSYQNHLLYFCENAMEKYGCSNNDFSLAIFRIFLERKKVLILFDGFDEISIYYKEFVVSMIRTLQEHGYFVWITTRPIMQQYLEDNLQMISTTIKTFTPNDTKTFLESFYLYKCNLPLDSKNMLEIFIDKLLEVARRKLNDWNNDFTCVPLHLELLGEVFQKDCEASIQQKKVELDDSIDILDLFERFFCKKRDIYFDKYCETSNRRSFFATQENQSMYKEYQQYIALQLLFDSSHLSELKIEERMEKFHCNKDNKAQKIQRDGIVVAHHKFKDKKFSFALIHRTCAEYIAAQWLSENYNEQIPSIQNVVRNLLETRYLGKYYQFCFFILDLMLSKDNPLHTLVINGKHLEAKQLIHKNPELIKEKDKGGRSALHLVAIYDAAHINAKAMTSVSNTSINVDDCSMSFLINSLTNKFIRKISRDHLGHDPMYYAIRVYSLKVANELSKLKYNLTFSIPHTLKYTYFQACYEYNYQSLFKKLLEHFVQRDLLNKKVKPTLNLITYCTPDDELNTTASTFLRTFGNRRLLQVVNLHKGVYKHLHLASAFGKKVTVRFLTKWNDVNELDIDGNTPLHYAVRHERMDIIKILLKNGAEINKPGNMRSSVLHIAAETGNTDILKYLLLKGGRINEVDLYGTTPLSVSLIYRKFKTARLLISEGADCNVSKAHAIVLKDTPFRLSITIEVMKMGVSLPDADSENKNGNKYQLPYRPSSSSDIVVNLVNDMNCSYLASEMNTILNALWDLPDLDIMRLTCSYQKTALHLAVETGGDESIVAEILKKNADVNSQDVDLQTSLHTSINFNRKGISNMLISRPLIDVNIPDVVGQTPLHVAAAKGDLTTVDRLIKRGADVNKLDVSEDTPLHLALYFGFPEVAELLLKQQTNINVLNNISNAPIHCASRLGLPRLVKQLIEKNAEVNLQNEYGYTPLHCAVDCVFKLEYPVNYSYRNILCTICPLNISKEVVEILLNQGASINVQNAQGNTPLHLACNSYLCLEKDETLKNIIEMFMKRGADVNISNANGVKCSAMLPV